MWILKFADPQILSFGCFQIMFTKASEVQGLSRDNFRQLIMMKGNQILIGIQIKLMIHYPIFMFWGLP